MKKLENLEAVRHTHKNLYRKDRNYLLDESYSLSQQKKNNQSEKGIYCQCMPSVCNKTMISGITLVALVVTIVVLLILAGITIMYVMGDNSVFKMASDAKTNTEHAKEAEKGYLENLGNTVNNYLNGGTTNPPAVPAEPKGPNGKPLVSNVTETNHKTTVVEDKYGNEITVPQGFKVVAGSTGDEITVQNGVVIEDSDGNQFVWIPVGVVTKNDGTESEEIKLGRYTFSTSTPGKPTMVANSYQYAYTAGNPTNYTYTNTVTIYSYFQELSTAREGVDAKGGSTAENATAKDLEAFVKSVEKNGGYYLARYEASYGSGYNSSGSTDSEKYGSAKPLSKPSTAKDSTMKYTTGTLWNKITQLNASKVARNMYKGNKDVKGNTVGVESDLVNSYAWDTAIVYITEMGNTNFANKGSSDVGGVTSLENTGSNSSDKFCNVYDMVANTREWTTETGYKTLYPFITRGEDYDGVNGGTASRSCFYAAGIANPYISFRSLLYVQ